MIRKLRTAAVLLAALAAAPLFAADTYTVDKVHSDVSFQVRHFVSKVRGDFTDFEGTIQIDPAKPEASSVVFTIKTASINTKNEDRDKHLHSPDFFDAAKFPEITFKSTKIAANGKDKYNVTGDFTMHGVTKEITLPVTYTRLHEGSRAATERAGFELTTTLNRQGLRRQLEQDAGQRRPDAVRRRRRDDPARDGQEGPRSREVTLRARLEGSAPVFSFPDVRVAPVMSERAAAPPLPADPRRLAPSAVIGFVVVHVAALGVFALGFSWTGVAALRRAPTTCGCSPSPRASTATSATAPTGSRRVPQFLLAFLGQTAAQKGVLWWASNHRHHHKYSDRPEDIHSPLQSGFWWSHMGWILVAGPRRDGPLAHPRPREVSRARLARSAPVRPDAALRRRALPRVRVDGSLLRLLPLDRPALARHVLDQQRHARLRPPRVRDDRRLAQQLPLRARHDGRGLAQQPPLGARLGRAGLPAGGRSTRATTSSGSARSSASCAACAVRRERWREAAREADRTGRAFSSARLHERVQSLTRRWAELRDSARLTAHDAIAELEAARLRARRAARPPPRRGVRRRSARGTRASTRSTPRSRRRARTWPRSSNAWSPPPIRPGCPGPSRADSFRGRRPMSLRARLKTKVADPIVEQLTQGLSPEKIALTVAVGPDDRRQPGHRHDDDPAASSRRGRCG